MNYYQQLYMRYRQAKEGMFNARDKEERAVWMNVYRWVTEEMKRYNAGTLSA